MSERDTAIILSAIADVKGEVGEVKGEMIGMGREIGELKTVVVRIGTRVGTVENTQSSQRGMMVGIGVVGTFVATSAAVVTAWFRTVGGAGS